jgi:hypothetical protein
VDLHEAAGHILNDGWTFSQCVEHYGWTIPRTTLWREVDRQEKGRPRRPVGRPTTLTTEEERWLAAWVIFCYRFGVPARKLQVIMKAKAMLNARGGEWSGKGGLPGKSWWKRFSRFYKLKSRRASVLPRAAAQNLTRAVLNQFYELCFYVIREFDIAPELIWNADETGFSRQQMSVRFHVITPAGAGKPQTLGTEQSGHISFMSTGSAVGDTLEPFVLLKGQGARIKSNPLEGLPEQSAVVYTRKANPLQLCIIALLCALSEGLVQRAVVLSFHSLVCLETRLQVPGLAQRQALCSALGRRA